MAVRFDPSTLEAATPVPVQDGVFTSVVDGIANASFAADGTAVFLSGHHADAPGEIVWLDPSWRARGPVLSQRLENPSNPRLSPDGRRLALTAGPRGLGQVRVFDFRRLRAAAEVDAWRSEPVSGLVSPTAGELCS